MGVRASAVDRQCPLGFDNAGQVEAVDVFHGKDEALASAESGVRGHDVGMLQAVDNAYLAEEPFERIGAIDDLRADDFQDFIAIHDLIVGEKHEPHAATTQRPDDFVVGVLFEFRRDRFERR